MIATQILQEDIKSRVRKDDELMLMLAKANDNVRVSTVNRWFREDNEILTTVKNLEIIRQGLKLPKAARLTCDAVD
jgi:hypothetical protein